MTLVVNYVKDNADDVGGFRIVRELNIKSVSRRNNRTVLRKREQGAPRLIRSLPLGSFNTVASSAEGQLSICQPNDAVSLESLKPIMYCCQTVGLPQLGHWVLALGDQQFSWNPTTETRFLD